MTLSFLLIYSNLFLAAAIISLALKNLLVSNQTRTGELASVLYLSLTVCSPVFFYDFRPVLFIFTYTLTTLVLLIAARKFKNYSYSGLNFYLASILITIIGIPWGVHFLLSLEVSLLTRILFLITTPALLIIIPSNIVGLTEQYDILCRSKWTHNHIPYPKRTRRFNPHVTLQVPIHKEPPDMVIQTLNKLNQLDYDNYEVMVIDNNTNEPDLWRPVEEHCKNLGSKFRFLHVENLRGAKAGALNWSHRYLRPETSILGVVDADYHAEPDFLKALVGYFDNPGTGFVQTPHDYRNWEHSPFMTMCYWEYRAFFNTTMVSLNERESGLTVGTMCLIRKSALEVAGGWSEWCVTEDSELAIRIHQAGYSSVYVNHTFGRGLIPDTFEGYKKQRYRWTAGPVQEFLNHRHNLADLDSGRFALNLTQRIHHLHHGIHNAIIGLSIPFLIAGLVLITSLVWHREIIFVPVELWLAATITLVSTVVLDFLVHKTIIRPSFREYLGKTLALKALSYTVALAAFKTLVTGNAAWHRTNKFKSQHSYTAAFYSVRDELAIGLALVVFVTVCFWLLPYHGLALMLLIGIAYICLDCLAAPVMAIIAVLSARHPHNRIPSTTRRNLFLPAWNLLFQNK